MARIFIAEDDTQVIQICTTVLERKGHEVVAINSGPLVLEKLKQKKPDLLVLDVMLPAMDGYSIVLHMSRDPELSPIPIVIITALSSTGEMLSRFAQVRSILIKPFEMDKFLKTVREALENKKSP